NGGGRLLPDTYVGNQFGFQGHRHEFKSGLVDMRARMYQPNWGRFINRDPIGLAAGSNQLAFVGSAPLKYTDPSGLKKNELQWFKDNVNSNLMFLQTHERDFDVFEGLIYKEMVLPPGVTL